MRSLALFLPLTSTVGSASKTGSTGSSSFETASDFYARRSDDIGWENKAVAQARAESSHTGRRKELKNPTSNWDQVADQLTDGCSEVLSASQAASSARQDRFVFDRSGHLRLDPQNSCGQR